jgi:exo-1,4-beta-D-glucosaminidase
MPNAGYYFMQNACEPVHIQLNLANKRVTVLNRTYGKMPGLISQVDVYDLNSKALFHENKNVSLDATDVTETTDLSKLLAGTKEIAFVVLNLKNKGKVMSHNVYNFVEQ